MQGKKTSLITIVYRMVCSVTTTEIVFLLWLLAWCSVFCCSVLCWAWEAVKLRLRSSCSRQRGTEGYQQGEEHTHHQWWEGPAVAYSPADSHTQTRTPARCAGSIHTQTQENTHIYTFTHKHLPPTPTTLPAGQSQGEVLLRVYQQHLTHLRIHARRV
jgi:hypothetical protein